MNDFHTTIIIPVFNRREITLRCLERLNWTRGMPDWRVMVVDDASIDGTAEAVHSRHPHVIVVAGSGGLFWTGGIAMGMREAVRLGTQAIIWLNDDTLPNEPSIRRLASVIREHPDWMVASTYLHQGRIINMHSFRRRPASISGADFDEADMLAGNQVAFSTRLIHAIGYPDETRWPQIAGDSSYSLMAHRHGFHVKVDARSHLDLVSYEAYPPVEAAFWLAGGSLAARIRSTFFAKKSRYQLKAQWHLDVLHHRYPLAPLIFITRLAVWFLRILFRSRS